ncbi:MAG: UTP--glucose-1-phosphate uridylyltransferase, partial [Deltaproteobacteria bacterium]|nr:UTP--glucose-1-phosphate uridylyltransferase [Deltaproteobacteria bacterium]
SITDPGDAREDAAGVAKEKTQEARALREADTAPPVPPLSELQPVTPWPEAASTGQLELIARAEATAAEMLAAGWLAVITLAGGQGSRLGLDAPKGAFPIAPLSGKSFFELFAEAIRGRERRSGGRIPWYVMTSPATHQATVRAFAERDHFGLDPDQVTLFEQGELAVLADDGRPLSAAPGQIALAPDGHGGLLAALQRSGALDRMQRDGTRLVSCFQVDNPLARALDPLFLGLHRLTRAEASCKVVVKRDPKEGLGNLCWHRDRLTCIEYSDLPADYALARRADGSLFFAHGNISIYALDVGFLQRLADERIELPLHRARKRVPYFDPATGERVDPVQPNAIKLERFLFDALPCAQRPLVWRTRRDEEFSPVKTLAGADSVASARDALVRRACRWLEQAGVQIPRRDDGGPDAVVEISPLIADSAVELASAAGLPRVVERGASLRIG